MKETGNISKSQTYGRMKNPRCSYPNCKYNDGFPLSWTREKTDAHELHHKEEDKRQSKLFQ
ncbi:MAG: hypothetical protein K5785_00850 [Nitrosarchaeum sp.]|nr:hypothetical protein [Nitrosarchaeum sp.]